MKTEKISAGIIGSGFSAQFHMEAMKRVYGLQVEVKGVFSPNNADKFANNHQIKSYSTLDELIRDVDIIHCCSIASTHESVAISALKADKSVIIEKPFTGYFGDGSASFNGSSFPKQEGLEKAMESVMLMMEAEKQSRGKIYYAENWVYAPAIQKEVEILKKTGGQILWMHGEESHSGSHSPAYGEWKFSGGGSAVGKGCHPLTAALYLKKMEGIFRNGAAIRPKFVSGRMHKLTQLTNYINQNHFRSDYKDVEDFALMHITFEDGTVADIYSCEIVHGGVHNWLEVNANNHRTICNINPNTSMQTYNPVEQNFQDIYVVEKTGTKQGWSFISPDEDWFTGYQQEIQAFYEATVHRTAAESDSELAADTIATIYSAYLSDERKGKEVEIPRM
jgi:predicted dehydrogenase